MQSWTPARRRDLRQCMRPIAIALPFRADPLLPALSVAADAALLPLPSHLLGLCAGSHRNAWAARGAVLAVRRLLRCHPITWLGGRSGLDPVSAALMNKSITAKGMNSNKNLILAFALSALVLFGWQWFVAMPQMKAEQARQAALAHQEKTITRRRRRRALPILVAGLGQQCAYEPRCGAQGRRRAGGD